MERSIAKLISKNLCNVQISIFFSRERCYKNAKSRISQSKNSGIQFDMIKNLE